MCGSGMLFRAPGGASGGLGALIYHMFAKTNQKYPQILLNRGPYCTIFFEFRQIVWTSNLGSGWFLLSLLGWLGACYGDLVKNSANNTKTSSFWTTVITRAGDNEIGWFFKHSAPFCTEKPNSAFVCFALINEIVYWIKSASYCQSSATCVYFYYCFAIFSIFDIVVSKLVFVTSDIFGLKTLHLFITTVLR